MATKRVLHWGILLFFLISCTTPFSTKHPDLVIHEYLLVEGPDISTDQLKFHFAEGNQEEILARTEAYRDLRKQVIEYNSQALEPFGYRLSAHPGNDLTSPLYIDLYRAEELVEANIQFMTPISVNASATGFIGFADLSDGISYVFTQDGFTKRSWTVDRQTYGYVGDQLLSVETIAAENEELLINVYLDHEKVYQSKLYAGRPTYGYTDGPWSYGEHWALVLLDGRLDQQGNLEMLNRVVQDGEDLNTKHGYQQSFQFTVLDEHPFYFFQKDKKIGISFDGQELLQGYDEVPHYNCCSGALLNPRHSMNMIWFFARRGADWYYIEAYVPSNESK